MTGTVQLVTGGSTPEGPIAGISLASTNIVVLRNGRAVVKLACRATTRCRGGLTISIRVKGLTGQFRASIIGRGKYAIPAGKTRTVRVALTRFGRSRLALAHGRLRGSLAILSAAPAASRARAASVRLVLQRPSRPAGHH